IFTGGTGLYFKALLKGLAPVPEIPAEVRNALRRRLGAEGVESLYRELEKRDPAMAKSLKPNDGQRILRALEVATATGTSLRDWQRQAGKGILEGKPALKVCLTLPRPLLEARIRSRLERMVAKGALAEVEALRRKNLSAELPAMKALGVRPLLRHIQGEISIEEAVNFAVIESRRYAKRQMTWFRNQFPDWTFLPAEPGPLSAVLGLAEKAFRAPIKRPIRRAKAGP
ncbi:MAG TPA: tRNA (adenosine(37)-N6)-dimethylallyltransferase MiaA, partial [Sphingomonadales bacterium]|nr:tRNA (adenosine(37)-N6)-dimethylallyltransferase MiaA [Sphingomonadales bacterium]